MIDLTNFYKNYTSTSNWTQNIEGSEAKTIALATVLHHELMKNENRRPSKTRALEFCARREAKYC